VPLAPSGRRVRAVQERVISVPDDVIPIIDSLGVPLSHWVTDQLRRHASRADTSFAQQLVQDATLSGAGPSRRDIHSDSHHMERSAPW
jgi:hypothetical protein